MVKRLQLNEVSLYGLILSERSRLLRRQASRIARQAIHVDSNPIGTSSHEAERTTLGLSLGGAAALDAETRMSPASRATPGSLL